jgi:hypothetical protein
MRALHRPMMHGEHHSVSLSEGYDFGARLHSRPLLGQYEFSAREIPIRFG